MKSISEYIESGIIQSYVLGMALPEETKELEYAAIIYPEVREAISVFSRDLEQFALNNAIAPDPIIKPMLLATIDFISRIENGEPLSFPPDLNPNSSVADFSEWLLRSDMTPPNFDNVYAKIIAHTAKVTTAIVWIKNMAPPEVHNDEYEKFLIVEGTCDIVIEENVNHLVPGDFLSIPLYSRHYVKITSDIPCKAILQRVAA